MKKHYHFIAIGGAAMHNMALALHQHGHTITGSDDEIKEPSLSRLSDAGILPASEGWFPEKVTREIDVVILGMHARADNPELVKAAELGIKVYSFPEFLYEHSKHKQRVVIGGSHGKTTITAMVMHVLNGAGIDFDYMVGAKVDGFKTMVKLSDAPLIVLEGDEYLASPIDRRPKFHLYRPTIGFISGIAWDHINVFPTFENYAEQFRIFADIVPSDGKLIYCSSDKAVTEVVSSSVTEAERIPYGIPSYEIRNGITYLKTSAGEFPLAVFGEHNLQNIEGARHVCESLGVEAHAFYKLISSFKGAARRLEKVGGNDTTAIFRDFAHSPSKLVATLEAVRKQFPSRKLIACMELHTFSSLNENFLDQYKSTMDAADLSIVYFNPHTLEHKKLKPLSEESVLHAFSNKKIKVITDSTVLRNELIAAMGDQTVFLLMSSGTFDGLDLSELSDIITGRREKLHSA